MAQNNIEIASAGDLTAKLAEILTKGTLYSSFQYSGHGLHHSQPSGDFGSAGFGLLPEQLKMYCPTCKADQWWGTGGAAVYFGKFGDPEPQNRIYACQNCAHQNDRARQFYWIEWIEKKPNTIIAPPGGLPHIGRFTKVGQWPPLSIEPASDLAKSLGKEDTKLYKKALISASISHGIAALAYFRRVIENKVNDLINLIATAAANAQPGQEALTQLEAIKTSKYVDEKIEFAKALLPANLRPGGHNPLDKLYGVASAGLHGEPEERCLELFAEYKFSFEYLFRNLTIENEEAREYVKQMSSPSPKGTR